MPDSVVSAIAVVTNNTSQLQASLVRRGSIPPLSTFNFALNITQDWGKPDDVSQTCATPIKVNLGPAKKNTGGSFLCKSLVSSFIVELVYTTLQDYKGGHSMLRDWQALYLYKAHYLCYSMYSLPLHKVFVHRWFRMVSLGWTGPCSRSWLFAGYCGTSVFRHLRSVAKALVGGYVSTLYTKQYATCSLKAYSFPQNSGWTFLQAVRPIHKVLAQKFYERKSII